MSNKRMFSLKIVDTDEFLDMPPTTQNLYFHLCMRADDDGFVSNPRKIMKIINSADDDIKVLTGKRFVIPFNSGICVIKHWKIHNLIRSDRYTETEYKEEKSMLIEQDKKYELSDGRRKVIPNGNPVKVSIDKVSIEESGKTTTPSEIMKQFLNDDDYFNKIADFIIENKKIPKDIVSQELRAFKNYWSELNGSGTKQKWELQKTWELQRRLTTWFNNGQKFNKSKTIQSL